MKWSIKNLNQFPIDDESKLILATEGIDAQSLLYPCELCDCFAFDENYTCIGSIIGKFVLIDKTGRLFLHDEVGLVRLAESVRIFIKTNNCLSKIDFSKKINWELVISELSRENNDFLSSVFWIEFIQDLYITHS